MNLLDKLKAGKKNVRKLNFPGTDEGVGLTVLTEAEVQQAIFAAERHFKDCGIEISSTTLGAYNAEVNIQLLALALVDPRKGDSPGRPYAPAFRSADELRNNITREARDALVEEYNAFEDECSPSPLRMSVEAYETLFEDIKKNAGTPGRDLSFRTLKGLITFLANRELKSPKDSGPIS